MTQFLQRGESLQGLKVISMELAGYAYRNGRKVPGWTIATVQDGRKVYLGDDTVGGFDAACDTADKMGMDTVSYRARLDVWVKTGRMPALVAEVL